MNAEIKGVSLSFHLPDGWYEDTPIFELKEILTEKYGEDAKLIYDIKDRPVIVPFKWGGSLSKAWIW